MNAVAQKAGSSETKSKPGKRGRSKQVTDTGSTPEKQATKSKKPGSAGSKSAGKKKTTGKKAAARKKAPNRRKSTTRRSGAAGAKPAAATDTAGLASLPVDPPPVTFPDAAAAADDPKSLSWMAQQAVSALNAVKAHQAEKGRVIMARAEKDKAESGHADSGRQTGKPAQTTGAGEPADSGQPRAVVSAASAGGSSGKEKSADTDTRQAAEQQTRKPAQTSSADEPGDTGQPQATGSIASTAGSSGKETRADSDTRQAAEQQTGKPAPSGRTADSPVPKPTAPAAGKQVAAGASPLPPAAKRHYPVRRLALIALVSIVPLWLYLGAGDETVPVPRQPEAGVAGTPEPEPAVRSAPVVADTPTWQPAAAPAPFPEPVPPASPVPESLHSADTAVPVAASEENGVIAQEAGTGQSAAVTPEIPETPETSARQAEPELTDTAPPQPAAPPARRAPGYGYYPPRRSWQPPAYYRPGYTRQPSR